MGSNCWSGRGLKIQKEENLGNGVKKRVLRKHEEMGLDFKERLGIDWRRERKKKKNFLKNSDVIVSSVQLLSHV